MIGSLPKKEKIKKEKIQNTGERTHRVNMTQVQIEAMSWWPKN